MTIVKPVITEKTVNLASSSNKYTFEVSLNANKTDAAKELGSLFGVTVNSVRALSRLGKSYRHGKYRRQTGRKPSKKIMVFTLKEGDKIAAFSD